LVPTSLLSALSTGLWYGCVNGNALTPLWLTQKATTTCSHAEQHARNRTKSNNMFTITQKATTCSHAEQHAQSYSHTVFSCLCTSLLMQLILKELTFAWLCSVCTQEGTHTHILTHNTCADTHVYTHMCTHLQAHTHTYKHTCTYTGIESGNGPAARLAHIAAAQLLAMGYECGVWDLLGCVAVAEQVRENGGRLWWIYGCVHERVWSCGCMWVCGICLIVGEAGKWIAMCMRTLFCLYVIGVKAGAWEGSLRRA